MVDDNPFADEFDEWLEKALALIPSQRRPFLKSQLGDQPAKLKKILNLLGTAEETEQFLEKPLVAYMAEATQVVSASLDADLENLKGYRLERLLGEGGMGRVYLAEQQHPVNRVVALKVMKILPLDSHDSKHFEREYAALAQMEHPQVARLYQAGTTASGFPFFTMEYVGGLPLKTFLQANNLSLAQRLSLFLDICRGVQHAHQKGIIHRDIKPSNILVTGTHQAPGIKLIDFGIARLMVPDIALLPDETQVEAKILGTLAYMSPERFRGEADDVRVDVYGLGAMLYELLVGVPVFDWGLTTGKTSRAALITQVLQQNPIPPSDRSRPHRVVDEKAHLAAIPAAKLKGDLDAIVLKALAKDRDDRYPSVAQLAEDVVRFVEKRPVSARPASFFYVARLWMVRKRWQALVIFALLVAIGTGAGLAVWGHLQATQALKVAESQRELAQKASQESDQTLVFLLNTLSATLPGNYPRDAPRSVLLDFVSENAGKSLPANPVIQARLQFELGEAYMATAKYEKAEAHYQKAYDLREKLWGDDDSHTLSARNGIAWAQAENGKWSQAEEHFEAVISWSCPSLLQVRAVLGLADINRILGRTTLSLELYDYVLTYLPQYQETKLSTLHAGLRGLGIAYASVGREVHAKAILETVWAEQVANLGVDHFQTLATYTHLANLQLRRRNMDAAAGMYEDVFEWLSYGVGPENIETLNALYNLMALEVDRGNLTQAVKLGEDLIFQRTKVLGKGHRYTLAAERLQAIVFGKIGKEKKALEILESVYQRQKETMEKDHPETLVTGHNMGNLLFKMGRLQEAVELLLEISMKREARLGNRHPQTLLSFCTLGETLLKQGELEFALAVFSRVNSDAFVLPRESEHANFYQHFHGITLGRLNRHREGEPRLLFSYPFIKSHKWVRKNMAEFYHSWNKPEKAKKYWP